MSLRGVNAVHTAWTTDLHTSWDKNAAPMSDAVLRKSDCRAKSHHPTLPHTVAEACYRCPFLHGHGVHTQLLEPTTALIQLPPRAIKTRSLLLELHGGTLRDRGGTLGALVRLVQLDLELPPQSAHLHFQS
jgi:hypothetical protein